MLLFLSLTFLGCDQEKNNPGAGENSIKKHEEALAKFQNAQKSFKKLIATVRDEDSFDAAKPGLDQIIIDWKEAESLLQNLTPPSEEDQERIQQQISAGHKATEPTGEDMFSLIMIDSREAEIEKWLQEFAQAGQDVGVEMLRLYGETDYSIKARKPLDLDLELPGLEISLPKEEETKPSQEDNPTNKK